MRRACWKSSAGGAGVSVRFWAAEGLIAGIRRGFWARQLVAGLDDSVRSGGPAGRGARWSSWRSEEAPHAEKQKALMQQSSPAVRRTPNSSRLARVVRARRARGVRRSIGEPPCVAIILFRSRTAPAPHPRPRARARAGWGLAESIWDSRFRLDLIHPAGWGKEASMDGATVFDRSSRACG